MALLNQFLFPSSIIRPVHMTLTGPHPSLRSIFHTIEDPYYNRCSRHDHEKVLSPSFDVRETDSAVFLEGEFPGVARKEDITIEKLGPRTLLVESKVTHFDVEAEWGQSALVHLGTIEDGKQEEKQHHVTLNKGVTREPDKRTAKEQNPLLAEEKEEKGKVKEGEGGNLHFMLAGRHVGDLQRAFTFPCAVDIEALKARFRCGLLVIMVPKITDGKSDSNKINIED
jgi:HSP20 family molecular chaperone IbpA